MTAPASPLAQRLHDQLGQIRQAHLFRTRRVIDGGHGAHIRVDGRDCINFCSNDYLGLAGDPRIAEAASRAFTQVGTGSGAAALVSGYNREHRELEAALAAFTGRPRALLFSTGWAANLGVLRGLLGKADTLLADELNHASLIDGGRLSGARYLRVPHADVEAYAGALADAGTDSDGLTLVAADSVFSMDGDLLPLDVLAPLVRGHDAALMVDDAHGFGVLGHSGRGIAEHFADQGQGSSEPDIYVATLGKALGCAGAFVAGSEDLIEYLVQRARSWVFSTAPPPALAAAGRRALRIIDAEPEHRLRLQANVRRFRDGARQLGLPVGDSITPIQPLVVGDPALAMAWSRALFESGLWVAAIRPPTVPKGTSRLRITLSAAHRDEEIDRLLDALASVGASTVAA